MGLDLLNFEVNRVVKSIATGEVGEFYYTVRVTDLYIINAQSNASRTRYSVKSEPSVLSWLESRALSIKDKDGGSYRNVRIKIGKAKHITVLDDGVVILSPDLLIRNAHIKSDVVSGLIDK